MLKFTTKNENDEELHVELYFKHFRNSQLNNGVTFLTLLIVNKNSFDVKLLESVARCSSSDQFSRPIGRLVALWRLFYNLRQPQISDELMDEIIYQYNQKVNKNWQYKPETFERLEGKL